MENTTINEAQIAPTETNEASITPLRSSVERSVKDYFDKIGNQEITDLYELVLAEVEEPLLTAVMGFTRSNQSKAAILLGLSRGTLRKKLKIYDLL